jgi:hypothetical protein
MGEMPGLDFASPDEHRLAALGTQERLGSSLGPQRIQALVHPLVIEDDDLLPGFLVDALEHSDARSCPESGDQVNAAPHGRAASRVPQGLIRLSIFVPIVVPIVVVPQSSSRLHRRTNPSSFLTSSSSPIRASGRGGEARHGPKTSTSRMHSFHIVLLVKKIPPSARISGTPIPGTFLLAFRAP